MPFLYADGVTYTLSNLLEDGSGGDLLTNTSSVAYGIANDGSIIGTGVYNGQVHAFLMTLAPVPEPTTFALMFSGLADAALVDTGDKKALRAVGALPKTNAAHAALQDKLACLKQTLHYVIGRWGFDAVNTAVGTCTLADMSANACFAKGTSGEALKALQARVDDVAKDCVLLAKTPFGWIP